MTLSLALQWLYAVMASTVFGATIYEALVVHPAWSRKPPESLVAFMGAPIGRMNIAAFWKVVAPLYALTGIGALVVARSAGSAATGLIVSAVCAVVTVAWTLAYFRPTIERLLGAGAGNTPAERLPGEVRRWIVLNWIRAGLVVISWWGAIGITATHG